MADEFLTQMKGDIGSMVKTIATCRWLIQEQKEDNFKLSDRIQLVEREMCDRMQLLRQQIELEKQTLLAEVAASARDGGVERNPVARLHVADVRAAAFVEVEIVDEVRVCHVRFEGVQGLDSSIRQRGRVKSNFVHQTVEVQVVDVFAASA